MNDGMARLCAAVERDQRQATRYLVLVLRQNPERRRCKTCVFESSDPEEPPACARPAEIFDTASPEPCPGYKLWIGAPILLLYHPMEGPVRSKEQPTAHLKSMGEVGVFDHATGTTKVWLLYAEHGSKRVWAEPKELGKVRP